MKLGITAPRNFHPREHALLEETHDSASCAQLESFMRIVPRSLWYLHRMFWETGSWLKGWALRRSVLVHLSEREG